mgnify:CR=1 FL=1
MGNYLFSVEDTQAVYTLLDEANEREMIEMYENKNIYFYCKNYLDTYYNDANSRRQTLQETE